MHEASTLGRGLALLVIAAAVVAVAVPLASGNPDARTQTKPAANIGAGFVELDERVLATPSLVRAFIPTGSRSQKCLVTYGESASDVDGSTVYCGFRTFNRYAGVLVTISLARELEDLQLWLTVYQQGAKRYGYPMLYPGN